MQYKIPAHILQEIKSKVSILDIVGEHVVLKKSGSNHSGLCPFHSERTPSFSVSETKGLFHCYGCKAGGDLFQFVMQVHGLSFIEAVQDLATRAGISLKNLDTKDLERATEQQKKRQLALRLNRFVAAYYHQTLAAQPQAQAYFLSRGVPPEVSELFYLGSTQVGSSGDSLARHLVRAKAPSAVAVELGLIKPPLSGGSDAFRDLFRDRFMFPVIDTRGRVVGFGGRIMNSAQAPNAPKYLNSSESLLFQKSKLLYGLFQAARFIREKGEVLVVEGYFDVLTLHARGFKNVVATCGTQLTEDHLKILARFASKVVLVFDADRAGQMATLKSMETGLRLGQVLYSATLPAGKDPDEVALEDAPYLERLISEAKPVLDTEIERWLMRAGGGPELKTQAVKQIGQWLSSFDDPVGRRVRLEDASMRLGVSKALFAQESGESRGRSSLGAASSAGKGAVVRTRSVPQVGLPACDRVALRLLLYKLYWPQEWSQGGAGYWSKLWDETIGKLPPGSTWNDIFEHPELRNFTCSFAGDFENQELFQKLMGAGHPSEPLESQVWYAELRSLFSEIAVKIEANTTSQQGSTSTMNWDEEMLKLRSEISRSLEKAWARFSQHILVDIRRAEDQRDSANQSKLLKDYLDAQKKMKEFRCFL